MLIDEVYTIHQEYLDEIEKMKQIKQPVVFFGAGSTSDVNLHYFRNLGIFPVAFCDNSTEKNGQKVEDIEIISFEETQNLYPNAYYYITTQLFYGPIRQQLLEGGVESENISEYDIVFQFQWESTCIEYYKEHAGEIQTLYERLGDEESRKVMKNRLLFLRTRNRKYMTSVRGKEQYFDKDLIDFDKINFFVDAGMFIGDTILKFIEAADESYDEIFGFEPDADTYETAKRNLKEHHNITFIPKATSDCDGKIQVERSLGIMQTIEKGIFTEDTKDTNTFDICKIDTYFANIDKKIDMIKMDVEGAEMASLRGAQDTLKKNRPVLAICVYHKEEDLLEIPAYVESLGITCQIYLRHYSDNQTETVCYLIPEK